MYCSGCGTVLTEGQAFCPQCGRPVAQPAQPISGMPPVPNLAFQVGNYRGRIRTLGIVWLVYAGLTLLLGFAGLTLIRHFMGGGFGPWMQPWMHGGPPPQAWMFSIILHVIWGAMLLRTGLAVAAGWGLLAEARWGRIVAIIAAILSLIKFPIGTAMGIWTLVVLLGYRNATLYERL